MRPVECISHDPAGPRVVEDAVCAAYAEAPPSLQTCNMHKCPEYRVAAWSVVSSDVSDRSPVLFHVIYHLFILHDIEMCLYKMETSR